MTLRAKDKKFHLLGARREVRLDGELGRGGEGTVYEIQGDASIVAKVLKSPSPTKISKLKSMPGLATPQILRVSAWPKDLLVDDRGHPVGFIMPRIGQRRDIHELYSPKSRSQSFVDADFRFLVRAALNIAKAFAVIHSHGHVIGDVNHGNLLAGPDATVVLIDCDSFQIQAGSDLHLCEVGSPLFTPPELQGLHLNSLRRTANHDLFGLAVLIFHILFMGRHPYIGRYTGQGDMPPEKAITEHRFAYAPNQVQTQMQPPPGTVALDVFGLAIAAHFTIAFTQPGQQARPSALDWIAALETLEKSLRVCPAAPWHHFYDRSPSCPWCAIEKSGVRLFGQKTGKIPRLPIDLAGIWRTILSISDPGEPPDWQPAGPWTPPSDIHRSPNLFSRVVRRLGDLPGNFRAQYQEECRKAEREHNNILRRWDAEARRTKFVAKLKELESLKTRIEGLADSLNKDLKALELNRHASQLQKYLDRFRLERAKIPGIGASRKSVLTSYGIETAGDIQAHKISAILGFGHTLTQELLRWRKRHEKNFRFNPNEAIDPAEISKVNLENQNQRLQLLRGLQSGASALESIRQEILAARARLLPVLLNSWQALQIAKYKLNHWSGFRF